jgi:hypothetical protein
LSVVICIARCICCGAECAICCCKCCTCCCPGSGGRSSGHKRMKSEPKPAYPPYGAMPPANPYAQAHAAAPPAPLDARPINQQYRAHDAPAFAPVPTFASAPVQERPQFATFESPRKPVNEDALPAMPSWGDARDRHVEVEEQPVPEKRGDMELDRLNHNGSVTNGSMASTTAVGGPRRSPAPTRSPISPIGNEYGYNQGYEREPLVSATPHRSPHASPAPYGKPYAQQDDYRRGSPAQNLSPVYGAGEGYGQTQPYGRVSPAQPQQPQSYNNYDQQDRYAPQDSYAQAPQTYRTPSPPTQHYNTSQAPYDSYAQVPQQHRTPSPPTQHYNASQGPYDNFAPAPVQQQQRSHTPGYSQPESTVYEPSEPSVAPVSAYPGQRSYTPQTSYPGQITYQAFNPGQTGSQFSGVQR